MRSAALKCLLAAALCLRSGGAAACTDAAPCIDAEPLWHSPSAGPLVLVSDTTSPKSGTLGASATFGFRWTPAVLLVPAPNAEGREVNLISHATDLSLGARLGIGRGMEVTLALPAGLYQRGSGIKGVTHQSAPAIARQSLHDPRWGFGFAALDRRSHGIKLRLELKLPLGDQATLMGEEGPVLASTVAAFIERGGWFAGTELGVRFRSPSKFFGQQVGTQLFDAFGLGYELERPRLAFTLESQVLHGVVEPVPNIEWLASVRFTPRSLSQLSFGTAGGTVIPLVPSDSPISSGVGTPTFRVLAFARWAPAD